jgi:hypothetical protein
VSDERRRFERLTLHQPLDGWFGDYAVRLIDVSAVGALVEQVEHEEPIPAAARGLLRFYWRGEQLELMAETARSLDSGAGLRFLEENEPLMRLIALSSAEALQAIEANARGDRAANVVGDETLTSAWRRPATGFVRWSWDGTRWQSEHSLSPDQPADGFTIPAGEDEEQVTLLCRTYQEGDPEARRLTRVFAELSVAATE